MLSAGMVSAFRAKDGVDMMYDLWKSEVTKKVEDWAAVADVEIGPVPNNAKVSQKILVDNLTRCG